MKVRGWKYLKRGRDMQKGGIIPLCHYLVCYCVSLFRFWYSVEWVKVKYMEYTVEGDITFHNILCKTNLPKPISCRIIELEIEMNSIKN